MTSRERVFGLTHMALLVLGLAAIILLALHAVQPQLGFPLILCAVVGMEVFKMLRRAEAGKRTSNHG